mmetsp:Transcript_21186/g.63109  ORF Transcript_21186/g.63109 Transcript_21186/m.63109 type:complete len:909 (-) Transcript_21186:252-2978(-)
MDARSVSPDPDPDPNPTHTHGVTSGISGDDYGVDVVDAMPGLAPRPSWSSVSDGTPEPAVAASLATDFPPPSLSVEALRGGLNRVSHPPAAAVLQSAGPTNVDVDLDLADLVEVTAGRGGAGSGGGGAGAAVAGPALFDDAWVDGYGSIAMSTQRRGAASVGLDPEEFVSTSTNPIRRDAMAQKNKTSGGKRRGGLGSTPSSSRSGPNPTVVEMPSEDGTDGIFFGDTPTYGAGGGVDDSIEDDGFLLELKPYLEYDPLPERRSPLAPTMDGGGVPPADGGPGAAVGGGGGGPGVAVGGRSGGSAAFSGLGLAEVATTRHQAQLLIVSLIEKICSLYDTDRRRSGKIFGRICDELSRAGIVSPLLLRKEATGLRTEIEAGFFGAMDSMFASVYLEEQRRRREPLRSPFPLALAPPRMEPAFSGPHGTGKTASQPGLFARSRYATEFEAIRRLGRGGFGQVVEARNMLDGMHYAIKVVTLKANVDQTAAEKVLREVTTLASLDHGNVVRYNAAWLEYGYQGGQLGQVTAAVGCSSPNDDEFTYDEPDTFESAPSESGHVNSRAASVAPGPGHFELRSAASSVASHTSADGAVETPAAGGRAGARSAPLPEGESNFKPKGPRLRLYIQMQLCDVSLHDWLRSRGRAGGKVETASGLGLFTQVLRGIAHIHGKGLIHRDVKPRNIFLKNAAVGGLPRVKLGDFGLATSSVIDVEPETPTPDRRTPQPATPGPLIGDVVVASPRRTELTTGVGTGTYASPEQLSQSAYDQKADIYSLGVVLFELLHHFNTEMERLMLIRDLRDHGVLPADFLKSFPREGALILWLTAANPLNRPTAEDVLACFPESPMGKDGPAGRATGLETVGQKLAEALEKQRALEEKNCQLEARVAELERQLAAEKQHAGDPAAASPAP